MHPIIRIICFLLLVVGLVATNNIVFIILVILSLYKCSSSVIITLTRLRWLFLSILILNLLFSSDLLDITNLLIAIEKIIILIAIVIAAHILLITTTTQEIVAALQWWLLPLNKLGLSTERLAVRIALVLDTVQTVQQLYTNSNLTELFVKILRHAETVPLNTLEIPQLAKPPWQQWIFPLTMLILILNDYI